MQKDSFDYVVGGGPAFDADLVGPNGRLTRLCKGGKTAAAQQAEAARLESKRQFELSMQLQRKQMRQAANAKSAEFTPASLPLAAAQETVEAGLNRKRQMQRRFGAARAVMAGETGTTLGSMGTLGGGGV